MTNKRVFAIISVVASFLLLLVLGNWFFSVRKVIPHNIYTPQSNSRVQQTNKDILQSNAIKRGKSMFVLNKQKVKDALEREFLDIRVVDVIKEYPNIIYVDYEILYQELEIFNGKSYFQTSSTGRVLGKSEESQSSIETPLIRVNWDKLDEVNVGYIINDSEFLVAAQTVKAFADLDLQQGSFVLNAVRELDLNQLQGSDSKFIIRIDSPLPTDGHFVVYDIDDITQSVQLAIDNIEAVRSGRVVTIKGGRVYIE